MRIGGLDRGLGWPRSDPPAMRQAQISAMDVAACRGEARLDYGLAIAPEDEPAGSSLTRVHLAGMLYSLVQADDHLAPALHIQLAEQVVDMQLRCSQADVQPTGDLLVTKPRRDQLGGLPFAPGERGCRGWRV